jgi:hypothetical protein
MSKIIEEYYNQADVMPLLINQKMSKLQKHEDILKEFEYWIESKSYKTEDTVTVNEYTAQKLAELSEFIDGEGAFMLLIELRENPDRAMRRISEGFRMK